MVQGAHAIRRGRVSATTQREMFRAWCRKEKFNNGKALSHVLMDGGCLSVPYNRLGDFYEKYIEAVRSGDEKVFVVEQKTERYNFFVDIDYKDVRALTIEEIEDIARIICDKVRSLGGKDALVSVAPPKGLPSGDVKTGIHINFPGFVVNQPSALAAREHVIVALSTAKGSDVDWERVVDQAVYGGINGRKRSNGSGFRMPWSHKMAKHDACEGKGCADCVKGRVSQLAYLPLFRYRHGPVFTLLEKINPTPTVEMMWMATVRSDATEHASVQSPHRAIKEASFEHMDGLDGEEIDDPDLHEAIEDAIRTMIAGQANASVKKIIKFDDTYVITSDSKYCANVGREHGSNHVYFTISNGSLRQKCHSAHETYAGRKDLCQDFTSEPSRIAHGTTLYTKLYPDGMTPTERTAKKRIEAKATSDAKKRCEPLVRRFPGHARTTVTSVKPKSNQKKWVISTNSKYCTIIGADHTTCMQFVIEKKPSKKVAQLSGDYIIHQECQCTRSKMGKLKMTKNLVNDQSLMNALFRVSALVVEETTEAAQQRKEEKVHNAYAESEAEIHALVAAALAQK